MNGPGFDRTRLIKLLGLLGSNHAGERDNAARMACDLIRASGMTWAEVLSDSLVQQLRSQNAGLKAQLDELARKTSDAKSSDSLVQQLLSENAALKAQLDKFARKPSGAKTSDSQPSPVAGRAATGTQTKTWARTLCGLALGVVIGVGSPIVHRPPPPTPSGPGLELAKIAPARTPDGLVIEGDVNNPGSTAREAPPLPDFPTGFEPTTTPGPVRSAMYDKGLADRRAWENWYERLTDSAYRNGAYYWAEVRSNPKASCYRNTEGWMPEGCEDLEASFRAGCEAAQKRLDPTDVLRTSSRAYELGWNDYHAL